MFTYLYVRTGRRRPVRTYGLIRHDVLQGSSVAAARVRPNEDVGARDVESAVQLAEVVDHLAKIEILLAGGRVGFEVTIRMVRIVSVN